MVLGLALKRLAKVRTEGKQDEAGEFSSLNVLAHGPVNFLLAGFFFGHVVTLFRQPFK